MFQNGTQFVSPTHHDSYQAIVCNNKQRSALCPTARSPVRHPDNCVNTSSMQSGEGAPSTRKIAQDVKENRCYFSHSPKQTHSTKCQPGNWRFQRRWAIECVRPGVGTFHFKHCCRASRGICFPTYLPRDIGVTRSITGFQRLRRRGSGKRSWGSLSKATPRMPNSSRRATRSCFVFSSQHLKGLDHWDGSQIYSFEMYLAWCA